MFVFAGSVLAEKELALVVFKDHKVISNTDFYWQNYEFFICPERVEFLKDASRARCSLLSKCKVILF